MAKPMDPVKRHEWVLAISSEHEDVHLLWDTERELHDLDHGTHCVCCPAIVKLDAPTHDPHGNLIQYAIRHRPAIERAYVPDGLPEDLT